MTKKAKRALLGLKLAGIALIIIGALFIITDEDHLGATGQGLTRASTSIEFGGDFYSTSAQYTGLAANAVIDLYDLIQNSIGIFFVFIGIADCCLISYFNEKRNAAMNETTGEKIAD